MFSNGPVFVFQLYQDDHQDNPIIGFTNCPKKSFSISKPCKNDAWKYNPPKDDPVTDTRIELFCVDPGLY